MEVECGLATRQGIFWKLDYSTQTGIPQKFGLYSDGNREITNDFQGQTVQRTTLMDRWMCVCVCVCVYARMHACMSFCGDLVAYDRLDLKT